MVVFAGVHFSVDGSGVGENVGVGVGLVPVTVRFAFGIASTSWQIALLT